MCTSELKDTDTAWQRIQPSRSAKSVGSFSRAVLPRVEHSQIVATLQPKLISSFLTLVSRNLFAKSFCCQMSVLPLGSLDIKHPCQCQKHPFTKIITRHLGMTISGLPGRWPEFNEYLNPLACRALRMSISGLVFFDRMPAIMRLRVSASTMSAIFLLLDLLLLSCSQVTR